MAGAFIRSEEGQRVLKESSEKKRQAEAAGDEERLKRVRAEGDARRMVLHLQGFSNASVDDILERVREKLPEIAWEAEVVAIVPKTDYADATAEQVDVTERLAGLFNPAKEVVDTIRESRKRKPADMAEVIRQAD